MNNNLQQYLGLFETEAKEHIQALNSSLVELEKNPGDQEILYNLMRASHTLKGMAATMSFNKITELCHAMEDFFDEARKNTLKLLH